MSAPTPPDPGPHDPDPNGAVPDPPAAPPQPPPDRWERLRKKAVEGASVAAERAGTAAKGAWDDREILARVAREKGRSAYDATRSTARTAWDHRQEAAAAAASVAGHATRTTAGAVRTGAGMARGVYADLGGLDAHPDGTPKRPWEVVVAGVLGIVASLAIALSIVWLAFTGGRTFRIVGFFTRSTGDELDNSTVETTGQVLSEIGTAILIAGVVAGAIVTAAFVLYAWRLWAGTGRSRWVGVATVVLAFFVVTPLSPTLTSVFLVFGLASVVFAFLPRAGTWFRYRKFLRTRSATGAPA
ncbi:hypothetical protein [Brevibacterium litoralis]|uniref:hypothetical protein n=1 Tax=Brevibacterium litoralis TaxID=3138935 RepID=UPI0032ECA01B